MNKLILALTLLLGALGGINAQSFDFDCVDAITERYEYTEGVSLSFDGFDLERMQSNVDIFTVPSTYYRLTNITAITIDRNAATSNWEITIYDDGSYGTTPPHNSLLEAINYLRHITGRKQLKQWDVNSPLKIIYNDEIHTGRTIVNNGVSWIIRSGVWLNVLNSEATPTVWEVVRSQRSKSKSNLTLEQAIKNLGFEIIHTN